MGKILRYAGIGSRETPAHILESMTSIGEQLAPKWLLRSGFADGADNAFAQGADNLGGAMELFLPWAGFNGAPKDDPRFIVPPMTDALMELAATHHPAWDRCSQGAKKLHARNGCQILGLNLDTPSDMVICWTPGGLGKGGTGQAIRIANLWGIPVFDLAVFEDQLALCDFVKQAEGDT
jgi:hypothetical protein